MFIDVHSHVITPNAPSFDSEVWNVKLIKYAHDYNVRELWVSALGSWGRKSPVYMPSLDDMIAGNRYTKEYMEKYPGLVQGMCVVNPNWKEKALDELKYCVEELGFIGVKLGASVRITSPLCDAMMKTVLHYDLPVLQHVNQHRRGIDYPLQEVSDAGELAEFARGYPEGKFILAHIGGGGDWEYGIRAVRDVKNIYVDICGSVSDMGMMEFALEEVGPGRMLFGTDLTIATALAKFEYMNLGKVDRERIAFKNALSLKSKKL